MGILSEAEASAIVIKVQKEALELRYTRAMQMPHSCAQRCIDRGALLAATAASSSRTAAW